MAITFDAVGPNSGGKVDSGIPTSISWSHTCSGTNRLVVVVATFDKSDDTGMTMTATYGGVSMTSDGLRHSADAPIGFVQMWHLVAPPTGASTVVVSASHASEGMVGGSTSYTGVDQTTPVRNFTSAMNATGVTALSMAVASATGNMVVAACAYGGDNAPTSPTGTIRYSGTTGVGDGANSSATATAPGASSVTIGFAGTAADAWSEIGLDIVAAAGGPSVTSFVTSISGGTTRNDYTGTVGMQIVVGAAPITVTALGRWVIAGNTQSHVIHLSNSSSVDLVTATVSTSGQPANAFVFAPVSITLAAGATYYLGTDEVVSGDLWFENNATITVTSVATNPWSAFNSGAGWSIQGGTASACYGPVSFLYQTGPSVAQGTVALSATAGMTIGASVSQVAQVVELAAAGQMVVGSVLERGAVTLSSTAGMTIGGAVTEQAATILSATAGMTAISTRTQPGVVPLVATAGMTIGGVVAEQAAVTLSATAGLTATGTAAAPVVGRTYNLAYPPGRQYVPTGVEVNFTATSGLTIGGLVTRPGAVSLTGSAGMTIAASISQIASIIETATVSLTVTGIRTQPASVALTGTGGLTVLGTVSGLGPAFNGAALAGMTLTAGVQEVATVALVASSAFVGISLPQTITGQVVMAPHALMMVAGVLLENDAVVMAALAAMGFADNLPQTIQGVVQMASSASLAVPGTTQEIAVIQATAVASLVMEASLRLAGSTVFTGVSTMRVDVTTSPGAKVNLSASTSMMVKATIVPAVAPVPPTLADQIAAVVDEDPSLLGATGYVDSVFTSRLVGGST